MTEDELFEEYKGKVDLLQSEENAKRAEMEAPYLEFCKPFEEAFNQSTIPQREKAIASLKPAKEAMDRNAAIWRRQFERKIEAATKKYGKLQQRVKEEFHKKTLAEQAVYDAAVKVESEKFNAEWNIFANANDLKMQALKEDYENRAKKMMGEK
jgi:hypothetical protein